MGDATPLMLAAAGGESEVAKILLANGADASLKNKNGATALDIARAGGHAAVASLLPGGETGSPAGSTSSGGAGGAQSPGGSPSTTSSGSGEWTYHNGSFVHGTESGKPRKDPKDKPMDNIIATGLKIQGMANVINRVKASTGSRKFVGSGSPPVNSFNADNKANTKYFKWAFGM